MTYGNYAPFYRSGYFNPMQLAPQPVYQPIQPQVQVPYQAPQQPSNNMTWVQGEAGMKAFYVAPNDTAILWDSENPVIYIKTADASGVPSTRTLDFTERTVQGAQKAQEQTFEYGNNFVSKEDFKALQGDFEALKGKVEALQNRKTKKAEVENE